ncbi:MAG: RNA-binding protein [Pseudomonas sp. PGPPP4]|uniref:RNA-binding protein n=2 Tax=Pseudomonadaceae TaxID=135621 RepID=A0ABX3J210_9PSED|nr:MULTISPECIES: DciA family protein [Pseudomonas]KTT47601.1 Zn-ribbon-containing protein [Pseudomonas psychrotolerans]MCI1007934.1 DUF721 domain-containing protein [Pseudomonas oryzihabitans]NMZ46435.1 DUF721 domain-containing protein [Pseudomonas oryzihabitans]ONN73369.1 RNA-binding protein [Pseudomonas psychrotolerans]OYT80028.1 MAG: RNA-binding protein [Pseudomonas sp. PGPPP4]
MAFRPLSAVAPAALLRQAKPLKSLFREAERLGRLQQLLEEQLQPAARPHCRVASWREGTLLLVVNDAHWATRLRYQQRRLLRLLQQAPEFAGLMRLQFKMQPSPGVATRVRPVRQVSQVGADSLRDVAAGIRDPKLKAALERLASRAAPKAPAADGDA